MNPEMFMVMWAFATAAIGGETPISALRLTGAMNANRQAVTNMVPGTAADQPATVGQFNTTNAALRAEWEQNTGDAVAGEAQARVAADVGLSEAVVASNALARAAIQSEAVARAAGDAVAMTNWQAYVYSLTGNVALAGTALQPGDTVNHATYAASTAYATNAGYAASAAFATNAQTAVHAQTASALTLPGGTWSWTLNGTNYVVTFDTTRVYVVSTNSQYIAGPPLGTIFHWNGAIYTNATPFYSVAAGVNDTFFVGFGTNVFQGWTQGWELISTQLETAWGDASALILPASLDSWAYYGGCTIDYVPVTNITVDVSAATFIIISNLAYTNAEDIAALEVGQAARPTFAATTNIVTAARNYTMTNGTVLIDGVYLGTNAVGFVKGATTYWIHLP